ncbi:hypothetical protein [Pelagibius sp.]|uniref:hypothetical protein n=1 Tax=Pelagibius sp. TaxID=1931238 RepID=UPI003B50E236
MLTLKSYEDRKHCITVLCGIPLTRTYVEQRLAALRDPADHSTQRFIATWGEAHLARVTGWFEQAQRGLRYSSNSPVAITIV